MTSTAAQGPLSSLWLPSSNVDHLLYGCVCRRRGLGLGLHIHPVLGDTLISRSVFWRSVLLNLLHTMPHSSCPWYGLGRPKSKVCCLRVTPPCVLAGKLGGDRLCPAATNTSELQGRGVCHASVLAQGSRTAARACPPVLRRGLWGAWENLRCLNRKCKTQRWKNERKGRTQRIWG